MRGVLLTGYSPPSITMQAPTITADLGSGQLFSRRRWERSYHEFSYKFDVQKRERAEEFRYFARGIQGDTDFWFDGGEFGDLVDSQFVGFGNGVDREFLLPDSHVFSSSVVAYWGGQLIPQWTLDEDAGIITFSGPPPLNWEVTVKYRRMFQCRLNTDSRTLFSQTDNFKFYSTADVRFREVP